MDDQNKNLILAVALSLLVIILWAVLFPPEVPEDLGLDETTTGQELLPDAVPTADVDPDTGVALPSAGLDDNAIETPVPSAPAESTVEAARIPIETPELTGTLSLEGGRLDDLSLTQYREELDEGSPLVRVLSPVNSEDPYYALHGWIGPDGVSLPNSRTIWDVETGETLTPDTPVTLRWDNGAGLIFRKTIAVDTEFLFTVTQTVENTTASQVSLRPYGLIAQHGEPDLIGFFILHEGVVRMTDGISEGIDYDDIPGRDSEEGRVEVEENGWIGFTGKYWMTTLIPEPGSAFRSVARSSSEIYQTEAVYPPVTVLAGETAEARTLLFAGAKEWEAIQHYQNELGVEGFEDSIDWGWFYFLTKPIFKVLHWLNGLIGNMGWAIILLTVLIKIVLLPLAYKSYVSMARMKELQPEMEKLKERAGDNREELQKGMLKLYRENKVNPAAGCLPILLQIPIFFSLYKVIFVTLELRHAPWFGWIKDLSAPDPSSFVNLFGILPWGAPDPNTLIGLLAIGILPIILGLSMWFQQKLNPTPTDPTQRMIFAWLPWVFMFMLGGFASGLVLYWIANNVLTFTQQYTIMRSQGVKPDVFGNIKASFKKKSEPEGK